MNTDTLRERKIMMVSGSTDTRSLAGAIANTARESDYIGLRAIGAKAVNQTIKAIAIAIAYLVDDGIALYCVPRFVELEIDGKERTAMMFDVAATKR